MTTTTTSLEASLASLTELETKALIEAFASSDSNGHDFGYSNDIVVAGLNKKQVGGVIANLIKKGIMTDVDPDFNQFALVGWNEDEKTVAAVTIYKHLTAQGFEVSKPYWVK
jgi:hypothetical protein